MYIFTKNQKKNLLQWAEWLEMTQLPQGKNRLKHQGFASEKCYYCCLGIYLENLYGSDAWTLSTFSSDYVFQGNISSTLPIKDVKELGLDKNVEIEVSNESLSWSLQDIFIHFNDVLGYGFSEIARNVRSLVETGDFPADTLSIIHTSILEL